MARKKKREQAEKTIIDLPSDLLLLILAKLDHIDRLSISVASKYFRSLTNKFVRMLLFNLLPSDIEFRKLFKRFSSVRRITIHSTRIGRTLMAISKSQLEIEYLTIRGKPSFLKKEQMASLAGRLGNVKGLRLNWFSHAEEEQVVEFIHMFRALEKLDLSGSGVWSDAGIEMLASNVSNLRKIRLDKNVHLTDRTLDVLSNCVRLRKIGFMDCNRITAQGLCRYVNKRKNLKVLEIPEHITLSATNDVNNLTLAESISNCQKLNHLRISGFGITDKFLNVVGRSRAPLEIFEFDPVLYEDTPYTMAGLSAVLRVFRGLTTLFVYLPLHGLDTQDAEMSQLVECLPLLKDVTLKSETGAYATLFSLIQNCPLLEYISIWSSPSDTVYEVPKLMGKNYTVRHIHIDPKPDISLCTTLKSICPSWKSV